ncbi:hypothetical protein DCS_01748 [Drechmeria coniospora]|uniref:Uncharacterized protein n=1 Tax=Drechmeria coniospora TaxID=98403 RepID=A0A151GU60_DRECN|nr:hypothetical protein DCS_01748 [Drechmeria coniospora]KYK60611.1 hypothetical protein DCS_01748 [Drechmeria coniospora]ODA81450.1 hypothetical protein RJ55_04417 [Drechmeria coniospora]
MYYTGAFCTQSLTLRLYSTCTPYNCWHEPYSNSPWTPANGSKLARGRPADERQTRPMKSQSRRKGNESRHASIRARMTVDDSVAGRAMAETGRVEEPDTTITHRVRVRSTTTRSSGGQDSADRQGGDVYFSIVGRLGVARRGTMARRSPLASGLALLVSSAMGNGHEKDVRLPVVVLGRCWMARPLLFAGTSPLDAYEYEYERRYENENQSRAWLARPAAVAQPSSTRPLRQCRFSVELCSHRGVELTFMPELSAATSTMRVQRTSPSPPRMHICSRMNT